MPHTTQLVVGDRQVDLPNPDKEMFPAHDAGGPITKADLVDYYRRIADVMVPHLRDRPLIMTRYPDGITQHGFYQKDIPKHFPDWIQRIEVAKADGSLTHVLCNDAATLTYLAAQACITPHVWLSRSDALDNPDRVIFDVDPSQPDFDAVRFAARELGSLLSDLGLVPFIQITGSKGVHVVAPIDRRTGFDGVREFASEAANRLASQHPQRLTVEQRKDKRRGRVYVDIMRNAYAQSAVAPYAVRSLPGAPVATPLDWHELNSSGLDPQTYNLHNIFRRLGQRDDPWANIGEHARSLEKAHRRLDTLGRQHRA